MVLEHQQGMAQEDEKRLLSEVLMTKFGEEGRQDSCRGGGWEDVFPAVGTWQQP